MITIEEINLAESEQKWIEPFKDLLDDIYYPGFAENLATENPDAYSREYWYFLAAYL